MSEGRREVPAYAGHDAQSGQCGHRHGATGTGRERTRGMRRRGGVGGAHRTSSLRQAPTTVQSRVMRSVVVTGLLLLVVVICSAGAQERIVVQGVVQWVAGTRMVMWADAGVSLRVDLMRADQRSYTSLRAGDRIVVVGTVAPERDRLLAESITSGAGTIPQDSWRAFPQAP